MPSPFAFDRSFPLFPSSPLLHLDSRRSLFLLSLLLSANALSPNMSSPYIYFNALTSSQSAPTPLASLLTLLANPATNPLLVSSDTPVYHPSYGQEWKTVKDDPYLNAAAREYYYQLSNGGTSALTSVSEMARRMSKRGGGSEGGATVIDGMTMVCQAGGGWRQLGECKELRFVLQTLAPKEDDDENDEHDEHDSSVSRKGQVLQASSTSKAAPSFAASLMTFSDDGASAAAAANTEDEFKSFLSCTGGGGAGAAEGAPAASGADDDDQGEPTYDSDGGTMYVNYNDAWVAFHDLPADVQKSRKKTAKKRAAEEKKSGDSGGGQGKKGEGKEKKEPNPTNPKMSDKGEGRKRKKANFTSKNSAKWIYVSFPPGLPVSWSERNGKHTKRGRGRERSYVLLSERLLLASCLLACLLAY